MTQLGRGVVASSAAPRPPIAVLARGLHHPEGVATTPDGDLVCGSDHGELVRVSPAGRTTVLSVTDGGMFLGVQVTAAGAVIACDLSGRRVVHVDAGGVRDLPSPSGGWTHPNAPLVLADDSVLVADSGRWNRSDGRLVHIRDGEARVVASGIAFANGLGSGADGSIVLIETGAGAVTWWRWAADGILRRAASTALPAAVPDGVLGLVDGSVLVACYRPDAILRVVDQRVEELAVDPTGLRLAAPTNLAAFGPDGTRIAVACFGGYHLAEVRAPAPGVAPRSATPPP